MGLDNEINHPNRDNASIPQKAQRDYFENSDACSARVLLPDNLVALEANGRRVNVPPQLGGSLLIKGLHYLLHHTGLSPVSQDSYISSIRRVFDYMSTTPSAYSIKEPIFTVQVISNAIKDMGLRDKTSYDYQKVFLCAIRKIKDMPHFATHEKRLAKSILRSTAVFQNIKSHPKKAISELHPEFGFTDLQYVESIRKISVTYHAVWSEIRSQFKSQMPSEYAELRERLIKTPGLVKLVSSNTPAPSHVGKGKHLSGLRLKSEIIWIRNLLLKVAYTLKNDYFTEALFLSITYSQVRLKEAYLDQQQDRLALKSQIDHPGMLVLLRRWLLISGLKMGGYAVVMPSTLSPLCLLLPWGGNEMGLYAAFLLADRVSPTAIRSISLNQFTWLDRHNVEATPVLASRATISGVYKGRQRKSTDLEITDRTKPLFHLLSEIYSSYYTAIDDKLIDPSFKKPFEKYFEISGAAKTSHLLGGGINKNSIAKSALAPLVVRDSALYTRIQSLGEVAFHELIIAGSQRTYSSNGCGLNPNLPEWRVPGAFLAPTAITQSRVIADQVVDLADVRISEDMMLGYSEEFYTKTQQKADAQFHSVETRLNVYYQRANAKMVVECRERFAAQVGDEMFQMALDMAAIASDSSMIVTLEQARAVCGLGDLESEITPEILIAQADAQGALINDTAFITPTKMSKTYVIKSDTHAFLMAAKVHHIDASMNDLLASNDRLVPRAIARRMLLMMLLSEFEKTMVNRAHQRLKRMLDKDSLAVSKLFVPLNVMLGDDQ